MLHAILHVAYQRHILNEFALAYAARKPHQAYAVIVHGVYRHYIVHIVRAYGGIQYAEIHLAGVVGKQKVGRLYAVHIYVLTFKIALLHVGIGGENFEYSHKQGVRLFGL